MDSVTIVKDANIPNCTCAGSKSWLDHWELFKDTKCTFCRGCSQKTIVKGIHVFKSGTSDGVQYILPLCNSCSRNDSEFAIWSYNELVIAICPPPVGESTN
jgi:hypothetical protein